MHPNEIAGRLAARPPEETVCGRGGEAAVDHARRLLRNLSATPGEVRAALDVLAPHDLLSFQTQSFYLNFLTVAGERSSSEDLWRKAASAARSRLWRGWEFASYLSHFDDDQAHARLRGWPRELIAELIGHGRGLIVCSFHFGAYRHLATDLVIQGRSLVLPLTQEACDQTAAALSESPSRMLRERHALANVEERRGLLRTARALRAGSILFALADGDSGFGGRRSEGGRVSLEMFGFPVKVKSGLARLAATFGAPILPLLAVEGGNTAPEVVSDKPILPGAMGDAAFETAATRKLYQFLERHVRTDLEQWESGCFFHRWRERCAAAPGDRPDLSMAVLEVRQALERGAILRLDSHRFAVYPTGRGWVCTDTLTLESVVDPLPQGGTLGTLAAGHGLGPGWVGSISSDTVPSVLRFIASLWRRGGVQVCEMSSRTLSHDPVTEGAKAHGREGVPTARDRIHGPG